MGVETATYISSLDATLPSAGDNFSQGDDHLRLIKSTVKATFPNVSGAVLPTHTELNFVDGVTSNIQTQINTLSAYVGEPYTWSSKTTTYTAVAGDALLTDTSGGAFTITLPISPVVGNCVRLVDAGGTWGTNNLTIGRNGEKINALAADMILDISDASVMMVYTGSTNGWRAV